MTRLHAFVAQTGFAEPAGHREAQHVGAPARRVLLVARGHVRRAHGAVERLAARAEAAAHVHRAAHPAVLGVVEEGVGLRRPVARPEAQVGGDAAARPRSCRD